MYLPFTVLWFQFFYWYLNIIVDLQTPAVTHWWDGDKFYKPLVFVIYHQFFDQNTLWINHYWIVCFSQAPSTFFVFLIGAFIFWVYFHNQEIFRTNYYVVLILEIFNKIKSAFYVWTDGVCRKHFEEGELPTPKKIEWQITEVYELHTKKVINNNLNIGRQST